jgi:hypothetical protein
MSEMQAQGRSTDEHAAGQGRFAFQPCPERAGAGAKPMGRSPGGLKVAEDAAHLGGQGRGDGWLASQQFRPDRLQAAESQHRCKIEQLEEVGPS